MGVTKDYKQIVWGMKIVEAAVHRFGGLDVVVIGKHITYVRLNRSTALFLVSH